jgi:hypothetical protein
MAQHVDYDLYPSQVWRKARLLRFGFKDCRHRLGARRSSPPAQ